LIVVERKGNWLIVEGHAGYAPKGFDIVCEAVSALVQTLRESFIELTEDRPEQTAKSGQYKLNEEHLSDDSRLLVNAFLVGMSMLEDAYPEYITVHI